MQWFSRHRTPLLKGVLRALAIALLVGAVAAFLAPATYRVAQGDVTFQLSPAWPGGRLIMPLGPAGVLELDTHHTPFDLKMAVTLGDQVPSVNEARALLDGLPGFKTDASAAFTSFLLGKLPWLLAIGALAGVLVANGGRRWLRRALLPRRRRRSGAGGGHRAAPRRHGAHLQPLATRRVPGSGDQAAPA